MDKLFGANYLNPHFHYEQTFRNDLEVKERLYICTRKCWGWGWANSSWRWCVIVDLAGGTSLNDSILDATNFDNIVFDDNVDGDGDEDDDEDGDKDEDGDDNEDLGDDFLRGLDEWDF